MRSRARVGATLLVASVVAVSFTWLGHARADETTVKTEETKSETVKTTPDKTEVTKTESVSTQTTTSTEAPEKVVWSRDLKASLAEAKKSNKFVLADIYTDWCGWCKVLDQKTFSDPTMVKYLQGQFLCVKLNAEDGKEGTSVATQRNVSGYPTALVFNQDGKMIGKVVGFRDASAYQKSLSDLIKNPNAEASDD